MFFNGKICDGCAEIMHDGEDIVVCPECGTPQHRECYNKNNACVNAHLHAEGFDWREANIPVEEPKPVEENKPEANTVPVFNAENGIPDIPLPVFNADSIVVNGKSVSADSEVSGVKIREAVTYIQMSAGKYLKKFIKNEKKDFFLSWNWGAFFFTPAWFFYRKLYKVGAIFLCLIISASLAVAPYMSIIEDSYAVLEPMLEEFRVATEAFSESQTEVTEAAVRTIAEAIIAESQKALPYILAVDVITFLLPCTIAAVIANWLYRKKMLEDIKIAHKTTNDPNVLKYSLIRRGGVSLFAAFAAFMAESYLPSIIMSVVNNFIY